MHPTYYRGFWHVVCRCLFLNKYLKRKGVYDPKTFIPHAVSRRQTFVHCARFPVAATRRCMFRISVTLWLADLSVQLPVIALVSHYLTNKLIGRRFLLRRAVMPFPKWLMRYYPAFQRAIPHQRVDLYALLTRPPLTLKEGRSTCMPKAHR